jgi:hypothetical protein
MSGNGRDNWNPNMNFMNLFSNDGNLKSSFMPFSWVKSDTVFKNPLTALNENSIKQITEYNQNWLNIFQK